MADDGVDVERPAGAGTITAPTFSPIMSSGTATAAASPHTGCAGERVFDLDRVHVLAAAVDHVLLAIDDAQQALVVDRGPDRRCAASRRRTSRPSPRACSSSPGPRSGRARTARPRRVSASGSSTARSTTGMAKPTESAWADDSSWGQERRQRGGLGQAEAVADPRVGEGLLDARQALGDRGAAVGDLATRLDVELRRSSVGGSAAW